ncbi:MAG: HAMP domain-containing histidine kinase [Muribaculaceae bacterium]|nr:HAMP domain-containing histidine kinase [Roseburia sp.]MCM1430362.1 HAMP domain-containing histidine kinase [Muribaculaceae bacterium]MCM1492442.1 HAMP domain-containing histidine kinase [Muribaculaceae bacterium]
MNIKKFLLVYSAILLVLLALFLYIFYRQPELRKDMVYYNETRIHIAEALEEGTAAGTLEEAYDCQLLFQADKDYERKLNDAMQREALIMDCPLSDGSMAKILWFYKQESYMRMKRRLFAVALGSFFALALCGCWLFIYFYLAVARPFGALQNFSRQVAKGNLDFPLEIRKNNYFGAFTESFDLMREELARARENEYLANQSKKELVAELSHDIKTPVSTIQAACEVLELKETKPDTLEKVAIIRNKAAHIEKLVSNLFHAALEELQVLKVEPEETSSEKIREMLTELLAYGEGQMEGELPECLVWMDALRLEQVIDNCVNNAWKYAHSAAHVSFEENDGGILICIRDEGKGAPKEELPRLTEKFYRGENAKGQEGSGLGLYLAKLFMEQMRGGLSCYNDNGFVVQLFLRKV